MSSYTSSARLSLWVLLLLLASLLSACGGGGDGATASNNTSNSTNTVTPPVTPTPTPVTPTPTPVVTPTNKVPSALDANATLVDGASGEISLVAVDLDGDAVSYVIVSQPAHGTLGRVGGDGKVSYTPTAGYVGADSFTYKVNDGKADSAVATVKLTVKAKTEGGTTGGTNRAPVAVAGSLTVSNSGADWVKLEATDADGDTLTFRIVTQPAHGTLKLGQGNVYIYTPNSGYEGDDSFTFVANDGKVDSAAAKVGVRIYTADSGTGGGSNTANKAPVASAAKVNTDEDVPTEITLAGKDPEGKAIAYSIVTQPANGTLSALSGNKVTYTPRAGYGGWDTFTFKVSDGSLDSTPANVSVAMLMEGKFIDSPVQGSEYVADSQQGVTGQNGIFKCVRGEYVEFFVGKQPIGQAACDYTITVMELDQGGVPIAGINQKHHVAQLLQSLDDDGNPDNGITLTDQNKKIFDSATELDFLLSDEKFMDALSAKLKEINKQPVTLDAAVNHVKDVVNAALDYKCLIPPRTISMTGYGGGFSSFDTTKMNCLQRAKIQAYNYDIQSELNARSFTAADNISTLTLKVGNESEEIAKSRLLNFSKSIAHGLDLFSSYDGGDNVKVMAAFSKHILSMIRVYKPNAINTEVAELSEATIDFIGASISCRNAVEKQTGKERYFEDCLDGWVAFVKTVDAAASFISDEKKEELKVGLRFAINFLEAEFSTMKGEFISAAGSYIKMTGSAISLSDNAGAQGFSEALDAVGDALIGLETCYRVKSDVTKLSACYDATVTKTLENLLKIGFRISAIIDSASYQNEIFKTMLQDVYLFEYYKYGGDFNALVTAWEVNPLVCALKELCYNDNVLFALLIDKMAAKMPGIDGVPLFGIGLEYFFGNSLTPALIDDIYSEVRLLDMKASYLANSYLNGYRMSIDSDVKTGTLNANIKVKTSSNSGIKTVECQLSKNSAIGSGKVPVSRLDNTADFRLMLPSAGYHGIDCLGYREGGGFVQGLHAMIVVPEIINIQQITATPNYPVLAGEEVSFSITTDKTPLFAQWNYGDGSDSEIVSAATTVKHAFNKEDAYYYVVGVDVMSSSGAIGHKELRVNTLFASTDSDNDLLPDYWEYRYGLNPHSTQSDPSDAAAHSDDDGVNNYTEFKDGTNPLDKNDWLFALNALPLDGDVSLTWSYPPNGTPEIAHYSACYALATIDRKTVVDSASCAKVEGGVWIPSTTGAIHKVTNLDMTKTYHFLVLGMDATEKVVRYSNEATAKPLNPTVPKNVAADAVSQKKVALAWSEVEGASGYAYCYSKVSVDCNSYSESWTKNADTTVLIEGLNNVPYYFRVVSFDKDNQASPVSKEVSAIPAFTRPAVNFVSGDSKVTLSWLGSDDPADSYAYCYSKVADDCKTYGVGAWTDVSGTPGKTITVPIAGLEGGVPYYFHVIIKDTNGNVGTGNGIFSATPQKPVSVAANQLTFTTNSAPYWSNINYQKWQYLINEDGSEKKYLFSNKSSGNIIKWSPDGRKAVFYSDDGIYLMNADGTGKTKIPDGISGEVVWSPSGKKIAFVTGHTWDGKSSMYTINADGSEATRNLIDEVRIAIKGFVSFSDASWSPDETKIVFTAAPDIYVLDVNTKKLVNLTTNAPVPECSTNEHGHPVWVNGGSKIAFKTGRYCGSVYVPTYDVAYMVNADGTGEYTSLDENIAIPTYYTSSGYGWWITFAIDKWFSPDGKKFAYLSGSPCQLYVSNIDGSGNGRVSDVELPSCSIHIKDLVWSPDGTKISFVTSSSVGSSGYTKAYDKIHIANTDWSHFNEVTVSIDNLLPDSSDVANRSLGAITWTVDSSKLAFLGGMGDNWDIGRNGFQYIFVTNKDGADVNMIFTSTGRLAAIENLMWMSKPVNFLGADP